MRKQKTRRKVIAFRVTEDELIMIENAASAGGLDANEWCRNLILSQVIRGDGLSKNERLLFEELARTRYLVSLGLGMLAEHKLTPEAWEKTKTIVEQKGEQIADSLLARSRK